MTSSEKVKFKNSQSAEFVLQKCEKSAFLNNRLCKAKMNFRLNNLHKFLFEISSVNCNKSRNV